MRLLSCKDVKLGSCTDVRLENIALRLNSFYRLTGTKVKGREGAERGWGFDLGWELRFDL
jgi:hypothetical protein